MGGMRSRSRRRVVMETFVANIYRVSLSRRYRHIRVTKKGIDELFRGRISSKSDGKPGLPGNDGTRMRSVPEQTLREHQS